MRHSIKRNPVGAAVLAGAALLLVVVGMAAKSPGVEDVLAALGLMDGKLDSIEANVSDLAEREDQIEVQVDVWEDACVGVSVQCTSFHSTDPASAANHNPVAVRFFVTRNGQPVHGLTSPDVLLDFNGAPAAGPGLERCDNGDGECSAFGFEFQDLGSGLYVVWVHPFFDPPAEPLWKIGSYPVVVTVSDVDGKPGVGYGGIEIES